MNTKQIPLLPNPKHIEINPGNLRLGPQTIIFVSPQDKARWLPLAEELQSLIARAMRITPEIRGIKIGRTVTTIDFHQSPDMGQEEYSLTINKTGIKIESKDSRGAYYAVKTFKQLINLYPDELPHIKISDYPDLPNRGILLDISRDKIPTIKTLYTLVDLFADIKVKRSATVSVSVGFSSISSKKYAIWPRKEVKKYSTGTMFCVTMNTSWMIYPATRLCACAATKLPHRTKTGLKNTNSKTGG